MNILIISQIFAPQKEGGAELVAKRTAEHLSKNHTVRVLSLALISAQDKLEKQLPYVERLPYHGAYLPGIGKKTKLNILQKLRWHYHNAFGGVKEKDLARSIDTFGPDIIYMHNATAFQPQIGRLAERLQIPIVHHMHDYNYLCPRIAMFKKNKNCTQQCHDCKFLTKAWKDASRNSVTDVIAVSAFVRDRLRASGLMSHARWHVLHNVEDAQNLSAFESKTAPKHQGFVFGYLGELSPEKGVGQLIEAFSQIPKGTALLVIGGRGDDAYVEALRKKTRGLNVKWLGYVDPNEVYAQSNAIIVPSLWHEPQALVVTEAVSRELIVIGSDTGGTTEILEQYHKGILYDPTSPANLTSAMLEVLKGNEPHKNRKSFITKDKSDVRSYYERLESILATHADPK